MFSSGSPYWFESYKFSSKNGHVPPPHTRPHYVLHSVRPSVCHVIRERMTTEKKFKFCTPILRGKYNLQCRIEVKRSRPRRDQT